MRRPATAVSPDQISLGIILTLAFCALAPLMDVASKLASEIIPVGQITTARFVVQMLLMLPVVLIMRLDMRISVATAARITLRALFLILSTYSFVSAVSFMPLADALAIAFVEPFILLILGHLLFQEPIGPRRIIACIVGFFGATLVIQPSLTAFGLRALWPLGTAVFFAAYVLSTRATATTTHPVTLQLHTAIAGSLILMPLIWLFEGTGLSTLDPVWPQGLFWIWLFGVGFWATISHICVTYALKFAPASTTAQLHYSEIASSVLFGYLVFGDFPNRLAMLGIAVIILAGLYVIYRERLVTRQSRGPAPQAPLAAD